MSAQSNTYVMVGVMFSYKEFKERFIGEDDEGYDRYVDAYSDSAYKGIQHHNGLCVVLDGMNGRHAFIGRVLAKTVDESGDGIDPTDLTVTDELLDEVAGLLVEHFRLMLPKVKTWAFTHYR